MNHNNQVLVNDVWERNLFGCETEKGDIPVQHRVKKVIYDRKNEVELVVVHGLPAPISKKLMLEGFMGYHLVTRETA
jgi:hypothetical protein